MAKRQKDSLKAESVTGPVDGKDLGFVLPHEHLLCDLTVLFTEPDAAGEEHLAHEPIDWNNLSWVRYNQYHNLDNLQLFDEQLAIGETLLFRKAGGSTIVDVTTIGLGRDPMALLGISRVTGLNIVMGSGYYFTRLSGRLVADKTEEEIAEDIVKEITVGVDDTGIRAGIIGEIGCSYPLQDVEKRVLNAAVLAQKRTGAAIAVHPGRDEKAPFEVIDVMKKAGAVMSRVVMCHVEARFRDLEQCCRLAESGCFIEYDMWGWEGHFPSRLAGEKRVYDMPNDSQRVYEIMALIDKGYIEQILISHDICRKIQLARYGGWGYAHIPLRIVPMMLDRGMTDEQIDTITVDNPKRLLCFL